jgi:hypothetical protein
MRTTLSLDDDVAALLERLRRERAESFKDLVNEALRRGLRQMSSRQPRRQQFRTRAVDLGRCRLGSVDNITEALAALEDESFK